MSGCWDGDTGLCPHFGVDRPATHTFTQKIVNGMIQTTVLELHDYESNIRAVSYVVKTQIIPFIVKCIGI